MPTWQNSAARINYTDSCCQRKCKSCVTGCATGNNLSEKDIEDIVKRSKLEHQTHVAAGRCDVEIRRCSTCPNNAPNTPNK